MGQGHLVGPATTYIAGELRAQKSRRNWTLDDVVERTGVVRATAYRAIKGESAIAVEVLIQLCAGMDLDVRQLITEAAKVT